MNTFIGEFLIIEDEGVCVSGLWAIVHSIKSNKRYIVTYSKEHKIKDLEGRISGLGYACTCPSYRFRPSPCKHIKHVCLMSESMTDEPTD